jgi:hypothetical protein
MEVMMVTNNNEKNVALKKAQNPDRVKEAGNGKTTDLELAGMEEIYGVKETLAYARGLNMENTSNAGELTGDQTDDLEKTGNQPHCNCESGDLAKKD